MSDNTLDLRWFCARMLTLGVSEADVLMYQTLLLLAPYLVSRHTLVPVVPVIPAPRQPHPAESALFDRPPLPHQRGRR